LYIRMTLPLIIFLVESSFFMTLRPCHLQTMLFFWKTIMPIAGPMSII